MNTPKPLAKAPVARTPHAFKPLGPPAVWSAFARQAQWKNWVLLAQLLVIFCLIALCLAVARTDPEVVVVDAGGDSHYIRREAATAPLLRFLEEQRGQPSDLTVLAFTRRFAQLFFAPNSSTVREASHEALGLMDEKLERNTEDELKRDQTVQKLQALKVRSALSIDGVDQVERTGTLIHLKVRLSRTLSSLADGSEPKSDGLLVELVERVVPRSPARPDGLEVAEMIVSPLQEGGAQTVDGRAASAESLTDRSGK